MKPSTLRHVFNFWPPFLFAGIHVTRMSADWREARVELRMRPWTKNYVGTHFGGSLFSMTDPFWMILVMHNLGGRYHVWDQAAEIRFVSPGRSNVFAEFRLEPSVIDEIHAATAGGEKHLRWFDVDVTTAEGTVVAKVRKQLYARLKPACRPDAR